MFLRAISTTLVILIRACQCSGRRFPVDGASKSLSPKCGDVFCLCFSALMALAIFAPSALAIGTEAVAFFLLVQVLAAAAAGVKSWIAYARRAC